MYRQYVYDSKWTSHNFMPFSVFQFSLHNEIPKSVHMHCLYFEISTRTSNHYPQNIPIIYINIKILGRVLEKKKKTSV